MKGSNILWFIGGAAIGSLAAWKILEKKYQDKADAEIESVKKAFSERAEKEREFAKKEEEIEQRAEEVIKETCTIRTTPAVVATSGPHDEATNKPDILSYKKKVAEYSTPPMIPYAIAEDEFGETDYECISMTYYSDGVLADDGDYIVENIEEIIGEKNLEPLDERKTDMVWVRNDERRCDYEIAWDSRSYSEVIGR